MSRETIPVPPFAEAGSFNGRFESRLDQAVLALRDRLREPYGAAAVETFRLPKGTTWAEVEAFYAEALAGSGLDLEASPDLGSARAAIWGRRRLLGRDEALAVALSPAREGDPGTFLLVLRAPREG